MSMKFIYLSLFCLMTFSVTANVRNSVWKVVNNNTVPSNGEQLLYPQTYKVFALNDTYFKSLLFSLSENPEEARLIQLPSPNGDMVTYKVWQTPMMPNKLAQEFPEIKTFTAVAEDNVLVTAKLSYTYKGFDALVFNGSETYAIDPYSNAKDGYYICYYKKDYKRNSARGFDCHTVSDADRELGDGMMKITSGEPRRAQFKTFGAQKKIYRLALACSGEYAAVVSTGAPNTADVMSEMTKTMNRVNGIFERELGIKLEFIPNNNSIIYLDPTTDPYTNVGSVFKVQTDNQQNTDNVIGDLNYDIGHVFTDEDGGIADLEGLCDAGFKARATTGSGSPTGDLFDVDYVAHEMGHQLGAEHSFNSNSGSCGGGNAAQQTAYEPGAGTTIMGYAGLCDVDNIQNNSDDYFHAISQDQMSIYINSLALNLTCGSKVSSGNTPPVVADIAATYTIPKETPFELQAPQATDNDNDGLTYCWEEYDLGDFGKTFSATTVGPIFRSFRPTTSRWRVFPTMDSIRRNVNSYLGEKLPTVSRTMKFKLTVRDILNGNGTFNMSDNEVTLNVDAGAGPFLVTAPNTQSDYWRIGNSYTVTWDVANTNGGSVSCSNVDIVLSLDDGVTYPFTLLSATANDGSETITVPANTYTASARVKVKCSDNVFFDISNEGFTINEWPDSVDELVAAQNGIMVYPVPAKDELHVRTTKTVEGSLYDGLGKRVWQGTLKDYGTISVSNLASGIYQLDVVDVSTGNRTTKRVAVQH